VRQRDCRSAEIYLHGTFQDGPVWSSLPGNFMIPPEIRRTRTARSSFQMDSKFLRNRRGFMAPSCPKRSQGMRPVFLQAGRRKVLPFSIKERARCMLHIPRSICLIGRRFLWIDVFLHQREAARHLLPIEFMNLILLLISTTILTLASGMQPNFLL
jgi:hypothetical protein